MNFYTEASHQPPGSLSLELLLLSMWLLLGGLNLEHQAHHLPAQTEDGNSSQAEPESQADWGEYLRVFEERSDCCPTAGSLYAWCWAGNEDKPLSTQEVTPVCKEVLCGLRA